MYDYRSMAAAVCDEQLTVVSAVVGGEGNLRPRRPPREYLGEYTS